MLLTDVVHAKQAKIYILYSFFDTLVSPIFKIETSHHNALVSALPMFILSVLSMYLMRQKKVCNIKQELANNAR